MKINYLLIFFIVIQFILLCLVASVNLQHRTTITKMQTNFFNKECESSSESYIEIYHRSDNGNVDSILCGANGVMHTKSVSWIYKD